jgi:carbamoyl-phosphate synthase large subunit
VMGIDRDFGTAFAKAQIAAGTNLPLKGSVFISVRDADKAALVEAARGLVAMGLEVVATAGTARYFAERGIAVKVVNKVMEGRPHVVDAMKNGEVQLVFNTSEGAASIRDSFDLRRTALMNKIPYFTTVAGAKAAVRAIEALRSGSLAVSPLQAYF